jgi:hypothetical protein
MSTHSFILGLLILGNVYAVEPKETEKKTCTCKDPEVKEEKIKKQKPYPYSTVPWGRRAIIHLRYDTRDK